jgi:hypothetical protein
MTIHTDRPRSRIITTLLTIAVPLTWLILAGPALAESYGEAEVGRTAALPPAGGSRAILKECVTSGVANDSPANAHGAASSLRLVAVTISEIGVYNRADCAILNRVSVAQFFTAGFPDAADDSFFDTRVIFDFDSTRFLVAARAFAQGNQFFYFAVSTSDTAAAWRFFRIKFVSPSGNKCIGAGEIGFSEISIGVQASRWLVAGNVAGGFAMSLDKGPTLGVGQPKFKCFLGLQTFPQPPIVRGASASAHFLAVGGVEIRRYRLDVAAEVRKDKMFGPFSIGIPAWTVPPNAPQPNGQELLTGNGSFRSASIQIGDLLWNVHTIGVNGQARWRLYKLSATDPNPLLVFTPKTTNGIHHNFNASVATGDADESAPAFVTFSRTKPGSSTGRAEMVMAKGPNSSATGWAFPTIQRSGTQFEFSAGLTPCNSAFNNGCRWGEYSATQVDPLNNARAWGFNMLAKGTAQSNWVTRAGQID